VVVGKAVTDAVQAAPKVQEVYKLIKKILEVAKTLGPKLMAARTAIGARDKTGARMKEATKTADERKATVPQGDIPVTATPVFDYLI